MLNLLNMLSSADGAQPTPTIPSWVTYVILGVLLVGMVLMMIIPQRKQKKRAEEMMAKLAVGSIVTSIGGIVGTVVELNDKFIWIETGVGENKTTMQLLRQAIHSIDSAESVQTDAAEVKTEEETDEIK